MDNKKIIYTHTREAWLKAVGDNMVQQAELSAALQEIGRLQYLIEEGVAAIELHNKSRQLHHALEVWLLKVKQP